MRQQPSGLGVFKLKEREPPRSPRLYCLDGGVLRRVTCTDAWLPLSVQVSPGLGKGTVNVLSAPREL